MTLISIAWLVFLVVAEFIVGERNGLMAMLAYMPQHPLFLPIAVSLSSSILTKSFKLVALNLVLAFVFLFVFMGLSVNIPSRPNPRAIRVMTWNVNTAAANPDSELTVINRISPDILFLQEIKPGTALLGNLKKGNWHIRQAGDIAIVSRTRLSTPKIYDSFAGSTRKFIVTQTTIRGRSYNLVGVHFATNLPGVSRRNPWAYLNGSAKSRTMQVSHLMKIAGQKSTIIAGDFNTPPRGVAYRRLSARYRNAFAAGIGFGYTYSSSLPLLRIDHVFLSRDLRPLCCRLVQTRASDHLPLLVEL